MEISSNEINNYMDIILNFISDKPWFGLVAAIIAGAAAFCAATPTPKAGTWKSKNKQNQLTSNH